MTTASGGLRPTRYARVRTLHATVPEDLRGVVGRGFTLAIADHALAAWLAGLVGRPHPVPVTGRLRECVEAEALGADVPAAAVMLAVFAMLSPPATG